MSRIDGRRLLRRCQRAPRVAEVLVVVGPLGANQCFHEMSVCRSSTFETVSSKDSSSEADASVRCPSATGHDGWTSWAYGLIGLRLTAAELDGWHICSFLCVKVLKIEEKGGNQAIMEWSWSSICKAAEKLQSLWEWIFMDFHRLSSIFTRCRH